MLEKDLIEKPEGRDLKTRVRASLCSWWAENPWSIHQVMAKQASAVLFLLGFDRGRSLNSRPCLMLSKRSARVTQAGDLCCPGGRVSRLADSLLAIAAMGLAALQDVSLGAWRQSLSSFASRPVVNKGRCGRSKAAFWIMAATALREAWEEIRLTPFNVEILAPLPPQPLVMFDRVIYPVCGWMKRPARLRPNWEVAGMIEIPLELLLDPGAYARFRLPGVRRHDGVTMDVDFPCLIVETENGRELLWGATYRICQNFLKLVFGFEPPATINLPPVENATLPAYLQGRH